MPQIGSRVAISFSLHCEEENTVGLNLHQRKREKDLASYISLLATWSSGAKPWLCWRKQQNATDFQGAYHLV